jgi:3-phosphoshikimate 1-carboxyvinyltransferase
MKNAHTVTGHSPMQKRSCLLVKSGNPLKGEVSSLGLGGLPGDKSISHRTALLAALASGESRIENFQVSGVTRPLLQILRQVGVDWQLNQGHLRVAGNGINHLRNPESSLFCGNSATTLRLVAGAMAAGGIKCVLDGSQGLRRRPMSRIVDPLIQMGVMIESTNGCAPLTLSGSRKPLLALQHYLPIASAQVKSCILIAAVSSHGTTTILEPGPSRDHTERLLSSMGFDIWQEKVINPSGTFYKTVLESSGFQELKPLDMHLPGDFSAAAFLIVAACITPGSEITIRDVGLNPTRTGLLDVLKNMGARIEIHLTGSEGGEPVGDLIVHYSNLTATRVFGEVVVRMIDEFPAFAVAAAVSTGESIVLDASELRHKESDRINDLCQELRKLGVYAQENQDGFMIQGGRELVGNQVDHHGDHRLAMSLAIAGLLSSKPVLIPEPGVIDESFPSFVSILQEMGADISLS